MNQKIIKAINFAFINHHGQYRKGSRCPYIVHPLAVMNLLLMEQSYDPDISDNVIIAGILHDVYEDTNIGLYEIEEEFGAAVRRLVENSSEPEELKKQSDQKGTWKERKIHTVQHLILLDRDSKIISCCDKLDNSRSMNDDYLFIKEKLWDRFNAPKENIQWYYQACFEAYQKGQSIEKTRVFSLLKNELEILCSH
jgi:(p)ppGpp synthase/HD superfamily hydrolase